MSGENRLIVSEITVSGKKGPALVSALNELNTHAADETGCDKDDYGKEGK